MNAVFKIRDPAYSLFFLLYNRIQIQLVFLYEHLQCVSLTLSHTFAVYSRLLHGLCFAEIWDVNMYCTYIYICLYIIYI